jgi:hypothetical protein
LKITSATIESVADTGAMFYLLQAPAEAATNAGAFFKLTSVLQEVIFRY